MTQLFEDYDGRRPADLAKMDGVSLKAPRALPHPVELTRWYAAGLFEYDLDNSCIRLTDAGRAAAQKTM